MYTTTTGYKLFSSSTVTALLFWYRLSCRDHLDVEVMPIFHSRLVVLSHHEITLGGYILYIISELLNIIHIWTILCMDE